MFFPSAAMESLCTKAVETRRERAGFMSGWNNTGKNLIMMKKQTTGLLRVEGSVIL